MPMSGASTNPPDSSRLFFISNPTILIFRFQERFIESLVKISEEHS